jgi:hypothetical protein
VPPTPPKAATVTDAYAAAAAPKASTAKPKPRISTTPTLPPFDIAAAAKEEEKAAKSHGKSLWSSPEPKSATPPASSTPPSPSLALTSLKSVDFTKSDQDDSSAALASPVITPVGGTAPPLVSLGDEASPAAGTMVEPDPTQAETPPILSPSSVAHPGDDAAASSNSDNKDSDNGSDKADSTPSDASPATQPSTATANPQVPVAAGKAAVPDLKPGEVFVDQDGNVVQG